MEVDAPYGEPTRYTDPLPSPLSDQPDLNSYYAWDPSSTWEHTGHKGLADLPVLVAGSGAPRIVNVGSTGAMGDTAETFRNVQFPGRWQLPNNDAGFVGGYAAAPPQLDLWNHPTSAHDAVYTPGTNPLPSSSHFSFTPRHPSPLTSHTAAKATKKASGCANTQETKKPQRKRKRATTTKSSQKASRRDSIQYEPTQGDQYLATPDSHHEDLSPTSLTENDPLRIQERNRMAANRFRVRKREDTKRLKVDEEDMERIHSELTHSVAELTQEVYNLKMRLLQHTDCDCSLIQRYIAHEAEKYIHSIDNSPSVPFQPRWP